MGGSRATARLPLGLLLLLLWAGLLLLLMQVRLMLLLLQMPSAKLGSQTVLLALLPVQVLEEKLLLVIQATRLLAYEQQQLMLLHLCH